MNYNFGKLGTGILLVCMTKDAQAIGLPREYSFLMESALNQIDSPESLAEFESVVSGQMSTMKKELQKTSSELNQFETEFK